MSRPASKRQVGLSFFHVSDAGWSLRSSIVTVVTFVGAVGGIFWAIFEYRESQETERTKYTLTLIETWEMQGYRQAYGELRKFYTAFIETVPPADRRTAETSGHARDNLLQSFNRRREVVYFFNRLGLCVSASLCSKETAAVFFNDTVQSFLDAYGPYIESSKETLPGRGTTLVDLSRELNPAGRD
jgi:VanZ family protein